MEAAGYLPRFSDGASAVEGGGGGARLLRLVRGVHHALAIILVRDRRCQGHTIIVRYLKKKSVFKMCIWLLIYNQHPPKIMMFINICLKFYLLQPCFRIRVY